MIKIDKIALTLDELRNLFDDTVVFKNLVTGYSEEIEMTYYEHEEEYGDEILASKYGSFGFTGYLKTWVVYKID